jgi:adenylylsulfate kinase
MISMTIWLTGLSGSGKTTLATSLSAHADFAASSVSVLDGDALRTGLCKDLGFSMADRRENIRRAAEAAKLLNDAGVTVFCALISPAKSDRDLARQIIGHQNFVEVHVAAPLEVCEARDTKGLYKKARAGELQMFTGISAPYEPPLSPAITLSTATQTVDESVKQVLQFIRSRRA